MKTTNIETISYLKQKIDRLENDISKRIHFEQELDRLKHHWMKHGFIVLDCFRIGYTDWELRVYDIQSGMNESYFMLRPSNESVSEFIETLIHTPVDEWFYLDLKK